MTRPEITAHYALMVLAIIASGIACLFYGRYTESQHTIICVTQATPNDQIREDCTREMGK